MAFTNHLEIFAEHAIEGNILSDLDYVQNAEVDQGFQPNTNAHSQIVNSALRQGCLYTYSLINFLKDFVAEDGWSLGINTPVADVTRFFAQTFQKYIDKKATKIENISTDGTVQKKVDKITYQELANGCVRITIIEEPDAFAKPALEAEVTEEEIEPEEDITDTLEESEDELVDDELIDEEEA